MHGNVCGKSVDGRIALFCVSVCMVMYVVGVWTAGLPCFVYLCAW